MAAGDTTIDGQLELKKRARRRLVGAAALALLAAIVLPMVMEHEPRQPVQDIQIRIPSQESGGLVARVLPKRTEPTPLPPLEPDGGAEPVHENRPDSASSRKTEAGPGEKSEARPEKPAAAEKPASRPAEKPVEKVAEKPAEKPAAKPPAGKSEEAKALAALAGGEEGKWVVQLGAYREEGRVKLLQDKLREMNIPVFTEKVETANGPRTRVRAGPFRNRDAAEAALAKIRRIGVDGTVLPQ